MNQSLISTLIMLPFAIVGFIAAIFVMALVLLFVGIILGSIGLLVGIVYSLAVITGM